jgi:hypothetical protein
LVLNVEALTVTKSSTFGTPERKETQQDLPGELGNQVKLAETGTRFRPAEIMLRSHMLLNLFVAFFEFCDVCLVTRVRHGLQERVCALGSGCFARKNVPEAHVLTIDRASRVVILLYDCTF